MEGKILKNRYILQEKIASGGMAEVYLAEDKLLSRKVAVKILHEEYRKDEKFVAKFHKEAKAAAKLSNPNIVNIYDVGEENDAHFIVMEYVSGSTLKSLIKEKGKIPLNDAVRIGREIAEGLASAHAEGIVHCDVKPQNILMMSDGHIKIADFGIARAVTESTATYSGNIIGSVHYFSPEQAKGSYITPKSDVYSLGILLYEMITGTLPFTGDTPVAIAMKHLHDAPEPIRNLEDTIPPVVEAIVMRAIEKDPSARPTAAELTKELQDIEHLLHGNGATDLDATQYMPSIKNDGQTYSTRDGIDNLAETQSMFKSKIFIIGIVAILSLSFLVGAFLSYGKFWESEEVNVPDVVGKQMTLARQILEDSHLRVNIAETYDATVPAGEVVSQSPEAGAKVKRERLVSIYVSKGGESLEMPDLKGISRSAAENRLKKMGLTIGMIDEKESDKEAGTVLSTHPSASSKIKKGETIDLVIAKEKQNKTVKVPNVTGAALSVAKESIEAAGLKVGRITKEKSRQLQGTVIAQIPSQGEVEKGSTIDLTVSESSEEKTSVTETETNTKTKQTEATTQREDTSQSESDYSNQTPSRGGEVSKNQ